MSKEDYPFEVDLKDYDPETFFPLPSVLSLHEINISLHGLRRATVGIADEKEGHFVLPASCMGPESGSMCTIERFKISLAARKIPEGFEVFLVKIHIETTAPEIKIKIEGDQIEPGRLGEVWVTSSETRDTALLKNGASKATGTLRLI